MSPSFRDGGPRRRAGGLLAVLAALALSAFAAVAGPRPAVATTCPSGLQCSRLEFDLSGTGSGHAETETQAGAADGNIDCVLTLGVGSGTCAHLYEWALGTGDLTVYAKVIPADGSHLCLKDGTCFDSGAADPLTFSLTNGVDRVFTGIFTLETRHLVVHLGGDEQGTIKATNIESIDCPTSTCAWDYDYGTTVTLRAAGLAGHAFQGWSGACTNQAGDCQVTMTANVSVTADFEAATGATPAPPATSRPGPTATGNGATPAPTGAATAATGPGSSGSTEPPNGASPSAAAASTSTGSSSGPPIVAVVLIVIALVLAGGGGLLLVRRPR